MSDFVFLFRSTDDGRPPGHGHARARAEEHAGLAGLDPRSGGASGHLKNPGQPLERAGSVVRGKQRVVTDGPYAEAKDMVLGFIVVEARDLAQAVELSNGCPMLEGVGSVEIRPVTEGGVLMASRETDRDVQPGLGGRVLRRSRRRPRLGRARCGDRQRGRGGDLGLRHVPVRAADVRAVRAAFWPQRRRPTRRSRRTRTARDRARRSSGAFAIALNDDDQAGLLANAEGGDLEELAHRARSWTRARVEALKRQPGKDMIMLRQRIDRVAADASTASSTSTSWS